ncbi:MAG: hypothetical protein O2892_16900 [Actinomycetota bacterium]|nr:hypothetical protein [Actinomycetota bacterium]
MSLEVSVADLTASAVAVTGIGEEMACALAVAEGRCESAGAGWQGLSGSSLNLVVQQWGASSASILLRLASHAQDLHGCAASFWDSEQTHAGAFEAP